MGRLIKNHLVVFLFLGCLLSPKTWVYADNSDEVPIEKIQQFVDIFKKVKQQYVDDIDDDVLFDYAIQGMVSSLDPHSAFLSKDDFSELKIGTTGKFGGLGIEITMEDGFVKVISPIDDTPASRAGLKSGDLIVQIGETAVKGLTLTEAVKLMRGKPGTSVKITVVRKETNEPLIFTITREIIVAKGIKSELFEDNVGYIRLSSFQTKSTRDLDDYIGKLKRESGNKLTGLILDLRNNPGGVLGAAVGISDLFLEEGKIVYTKGRTSSSDLNYSATPQDILHGLPIVVMINEGSASASEIVAGALQDNKRATIVGTKSYGKASVQTIQEMNNGTALKLTTARYYTPNGRDIHKLGIEPDIIIELKKKTEKEETSKETENKKLSERIKNDSQLAEAINILKGLKSTRIY